MAQSSLLGSLASSGSTSRSSGGGGFGSGGSSLSQSSKKTRRWLEEAASLLVSMSVLLGLLEGESAGGERSLGLGGTQSGGANGGARREL